MSDIPHNPIPHKQIHPALQFLILIGLLLGMIGAGQIMAGVIITVKYGQDVLIDLANAKLSSAHVQSALWITQTVGTTIPILITPIIFSYAIVREPDDYLKNNTHFPTVLLFLIFLIMLFAFPVIEFLGNLNQKFPISKALRDYESEVEKMSESMLQMSTFWAMIFNLLFIGLLTAIIEEVLFRGAMQTIFIRWLKNKHVAIWLVAILFSAFHLEFSGFIPRMFLGLLFGYFTVWSGSIWPAIWAHFVNNGTIVMLTYMAQQKMINIDPNDQHSFNGVIYIISGVIMIVLLYFSRYIAVKRQFSDHGEELG
jgi:membrane protease YdiL (CAAX protease family)